MVQGNSDWYYLDSTDGKMITGWINDGNKRYYADKDGKMQTGWLVDGKNTISLLLQVL